MFVAVFMSETLQKLIVHIRNGNTCNMLLTLQIMLVFSIITHFPNGNFREVITVNISKTFMSYPFYKIEGGYSQWNNEHSFLEYLPHPVKEAFVSTTSSGSSHVKYLVNKFEFILGEWSRYTKCIHIYQSNDCFFILWIDNKYMQVEQEW